jgi:hypothetical protein
MPFAVNRYRSSAPPSARGAGAIFAIGRHVHVACPAASTSGVTVTDDSGATAHGKLHDGAEVEIIAWRPRGTLGTRYLVRSPLHGIEGWLGAGELRRSRVQPPAVGTAPSKGEG